MDSVDYSQTYLYPNYLKSARNKLLFCKNLIGRLEEDSELTNEDKNLFLHEIYYLSGYIVEGFFVYSIYKHSEWIEDEPIDTAVCNVRGCGYKIAFNSDRKNGVFGVSGHKYREYVEIVRNLPYFRGLSYITKQNKPIEKLIDNWQAQIRYVYREDEDKDNTFFKHINLQNMKDLMAWCDKVYKKIITQLY